MTCLLCHEPILTADDVAARTKSGRFGICAACWCRETDSDLTLGRALRTQVRRVLADLRAQALSGAAACLQCGTRTNNEPTICEDCADTAVGRAARASPSFAKTMRQSFSQLAGSPVIESGRCMVCSCTVPSRNLFKLKAIHDRGLGLCDECVKTPLGGELNYNYDFLREMAAALEESERPDTPEPEGDSDAQPDAT